MQDRNGRPLLRGEDNKQARERMIQQLSCILLAFHKIKQEEQTAQFGEPMLRRHDM